MSDRKVVVRQIRSVIGRDPRTRKALHALGLGRVGKQRQYNATPALLGIVRQVGHLVTVHEIH